MKICVFCGEKFTDNDLIELSEMGKQFYCDYETNEFICPDCWDDYNRQTLEQQLDKILDTH